MTLGSNSLFTGINMGLTNAYSLIAQTYGAAGVTPTNISAAMSNSNLATRLNPTFASYLQTNFASLDADKDGKLGANELNNMTSMIATTGLTQAQLAQLGPASGLSGDTLAQVLEHFYDIDSNHDGKVTPAEISAYTLKSSEDKKRTEFANKAAGNMSVFYGDDASSGVADSSSLLDFKYMKTGSNSSSSNGMI